MLTIIIKFDWMQSTASFTLFKANLCSLMCMKVIIGWPMLSLRLMPSLLCYLLG